MTFSSWFMRETRRELVVLVRSLWGILIPRSIAYNRPDNSNRSYRIEGSYGAAWKGLGL
jgi:hypothetical protein